MAFNYSKMANIHEAKIHLPRLLERAQAADAHRQSVAVAASDHADDDQAFIDALCVDVLA
ncbi:MAG: hypothetical protein OXG40_08705 [Acidimicrobiaceae bacterium]|nr:hypothetical protein [Acidimicrobiaceae bacterium]MDE0495130.1 hypothetical protein [Acidimicrobiaceae bacterium]